MMLAWHPTARLQGQGNVYVSGTFYIGLFKVTTSNLFDF